jgi:hypothetical protein
VVSRPDKASLLDGVPKGKALAAVAAKAYILRVVSYLLFADCLLNAASLTLIGLHTSQ